MKYLFLIFLTACSIVRQNTKTEPYIEESIMSYPSGSNYWNSTVTKTITVFNPMDKDVRVRLHCNNYSELITYFNVSANSDESVLMTVSSFDMYDRVCEISYLDLSIR